MVREELIALTGRDDCSLLFENTAYNFKIYRLKVADHSHDILFTEGMANYAQEVNEENNDLKHIELYFYLPEYWNLEIEDWPIYWLDRIAQVPQKNNTWFGHGDTIPAGNPPVSLQPNFEANHFILSRPKALDELTNFSWKAPTKLLAVIPIFEKELNFKLRNSHSVLFKKFEKNNIDEKIDIYRTSCCRNRFLGLV